MTPRFLRKAIPCPLDLPALFLRKERTWHSWLSQPFQAHKARSAGPAVCFVHHETMGLAHCFTVQGSGRSCGAFCGAAVYCPGSAPEHSRDLDTNQVRQAGKDARDGVFVAVVDMEVVVQSCFEHAVANQVGGLLHRSWLARGAHSVEKGIILAALYCLERASTIIDRLASAIMPLFMHGPLESCTYGKATTHHNQSQPKEVFPNEGLQLSPSRI